MPRSHRLLVVVPALGLLTSCAIDPSAKPSPAATPTLTSTPAVAARLATMVAEGFCGLVLVADGDNVLARFANGRADERAPALLRTDTPFRFASVTKQMTAVLVMQAVDAGRLRLDETAKQVWPACPAPNAATITVRQLLQHMSGLPDPETQHAFESRALVGLSHRALVATLPPTPAAAPGERFVYNNADYWLLGALLEHVHRRPFADILRDGIFTPAKMATAGLYQRAGEAPPDHARGHEGATRQPEAPRELAVYGAAGAAFGTLDDLLAFDRALLRGELLSLSAFASMSTPNDYGAALGVWSYALTAGNESLRIVERQGWIGGIKVLNLISPSHGLVVIVVSNDDRPRLDATWSGGGHGAELLRAAFADRNRAS
jgi:D-alanyl-D-alanine carboxypeptidase